MKPTEQQQVAAEYVKQGHSLKIRAGAGTGKSSTLRYAAQVCGERTKILLLAYNRTLAEEAAKSMPRHVQSRTINSLAYRTHGVPFKDRLNQRMTGTMAASYAGFHDPYLDDGPFHLTNSAVGVLLNQWVERYCQSADDILSTKHLPPSLVLESLEPSAYDKACDDREVHREYHSRLADMLYEYAKRLWDKLSDPSESVPTTHDVYLKLWALSRPKLPFDRIFLDEAQDINSVILGVLHHQSSPVIYVGDTYQQIYAWRGAVNAMDKIRTEKTCDLTQSFRFGPAIADLANRTLRHFLGVTDFALQGTPTIDSRIGPVAQPTAILARTNAGAILHAVQERSKGRSVAFYGGTGELKAMIGAARKLQLGQPFDYAPFANFQTFQDLVDHSETRMCRDLKVFVRLYLEYGADGLFQLLDSFVPDDQAEVIVSTVHKAKGWQSPHVHLADDFVDRDSRGFRPEEGNIAYVAVTRGQLSVNPFESEAFQPCLDGLVSAAAAAETATPAKVQDPSITPSPCDSLVRDGRVQVILDLQPEEVSSLFDTKVSYFDLVQELTQYVRSKYLAGTRQIDDLLF